MQNFPALGAPPLTPVPPAAGVFAPSPHWPSATGGSAPRPKNYPHPYCEFLATRLVPFLVKTFFWSPPEFGEKKFSIFGEDFFCSSLNLLTWKKWWSRFIPPMLKVGQNWGKIADYPPQCSTKICTPACKHLPRNYLDSVVLQGKLGWCSVSQPTASFLLYPQLQRSIRLAKDPFLLESSDWMFLRHLRLRAHIAEYYLCWHCHLMTHWCLVVTVPLLLNLGVWSALLFLTQWYQT